MFFSAFMHHACLDVSSLISNRKVIGFGCSTLPLKSPLVRFPPCATVQNTRSISFISDSHTKDKTRFSLGEKVYDSFVQKIAHHVERQHLFAQVHHFDVSGQSGSIARTARSTASDSDPPQATTASPKTAEWYDAVAVATLKNRVEKWNGAPARSTGANRTQKERGGCVECLCDGEKLGEAVVVSVDGREGGKERGEGGREGERGGGGGGGGGGGVCVCAGGGCVRGGWGSGREKRRRVWKGRGGRTVRESGAV